MDVDLGTDRADIIGRVERLERDNERLQELADEAMKFVEEFYDKAILGYNRDLCFRAYKFLAKNNPDFDTEGGG